MEEKIRTTLIHLFSILLGVLFILDGIVRLSGMSMPFQIISAGAYPTVLYYGISLVELIGGIFMLVEDLRFYGSTLAVLSTIVGIVYGFGSTDYRMLAMPVLFFIGSWIIAFSSMPERVQRFACSMPLFKMTHACKITVHH